MDLGTLILATGVAAVLGLCAGLAINGVGYRLGQRVERRRQQRQARQDIANVLALFGPKAMEVS